MRSVDGIVFLAIGVPAGDRDRMPPRPGTGLATDLFMETGLKFQVGKPTALPTLRARFANAPQMRLRRDRGSRPRRLPEFSTTAW
jgi:hypothetical protein